MTEQGINAVKKVLVLSDSHGNVGTLQGILMKAENEGGFDAVVHLGDGARDLDAFADHLPVRYQLRGNCDVSGGAMELDEMLFNARVLMCHGHEYGVRLSTRKLKRRAMQLCASAALFGHTHTQLCRLEEGILLLNPGAAQDGMYAILTVFPDGLLSAELMGVNKF